MFDGPQLDRRRFLVSAAALGATVALPAWARKAPPTFPELEVSGSAGDIGAAIGKHFRSRIESNVGLYLDWLREQVALDRDRALELAGGFEGVLGAHAPHLLEEMEGLASGAGRDRREVLLINARTALLVLGRHEIGETDDDRQPGCTSMALAGEVDGQRSLALGQNWDWRPVFAGNTVILRIARTGAPRLVTVTEAGMVGKIGFNELRLGVCLNFLSHDTESPDHEFGLPVHVLLRLVMECHSVRQAVDTVTWPPRCASANFMLAQHGDGEPVALDLEWTPDAVARLSMVDDALVHSNHYLHPTLSGGCSRGPHHTTADRLSVANRMAADLRGSEPDPVDRMKRILADRTGAPYSVSRSPGPESASQTLASVIMDLHRNRLLVAAGQPHEVPYVELAGV